MNIHPLNTKFKEVMSCVNNQALAEVQNKLVQELAELEKQYHNKRIQLLILSCRGDYLSADGYPNWQALEIIKLWSYEDPEGVFEFMRRLWCYPERFLVESKREEVTGDSYKEYVISTAGWSGNESLINALQSNRVIWSTTLQAYQTGGHYMFKVQSEKEKDAEQSNG